MIELTLQEVVGICISTGQKCIASIFLLFTHFITYDQKVFSNPE